MQFTPQQLSGGQKYNSAVKIGNWAEDRARAELEAKDYELRRSRGTLASASAAETRGVSLQSVPHSYSSDGNLRYGDTIMLSVAEEDRKGVQHEHYLANNIFDQVDWQRKTVAVSATKGSRALARTTFVITRPKGGSTLESKEGDDVLLYGEPFMLASNPSLRVDKRTGFVRAPFYLDSEPGSAVGGGGATQTVQMAPKPGVGTLWVVVGADGNRLAHDGTPVPANEGVAIFHKATNVALAAVLGNNTVGDYGSELAVNCNTIKGTGRGGAGASRPGNVWKFVTAADPSAAVDTRDLKAMTPEYVLAKTKETIAKRGAYAFRGLARAFRIMDDRGDGNLDREDFKWGLHDYGVHLTDEEFELVLDAYDRDNSGLISLTEFLAATRGEMNDARKALVARAFAKLDKDGSGLVTVADLQGVYDTSFHPGVQDGTMTHEEALTEFLGNWDTQEADGIVTLSEFEQYYGDISASIDRDDYFELMITRAWKLE